LAAEPGAAYRDALLLKDLAHSRTHRSPLSRRKFVDKPLTHRLAAALVLVELKPEPWQIHLTAKAKGCCF